MSAHQSVSGLDEIQAPWNKQITLEEITYEGGFTMVRLRIKEGRRFTDLELDTETATRLGRGLLAWADSREET